MTNASRHSRPRSHPDRNSIARYGTVGSLTLWALTLAGTPFYVIVALLFGLSYAAVDRVCHIGRAGRLAIKQAIGGALPMADSLSVLITRLKVGADEALRPLIQKRSDRVVISLPRALVFSEGEAVPLSGARDLLARLADAIQSGAWRVDVIGYGDSSGLIKERTEPHTLDLSSRRARAAADALRAAGCRGPIAILGAPMGHSTDPQPAPSAGQAEAPVLDIVIRGQKRGQRDAA